MNAAYKIAAELLGLFVEDRTFAIAIALCIAGVALEARAHPAPGPQAGVLLFAAMAVIMLASVFRASRRR